MEKRKATLVLLLILLLMGCAGAAAAMYLKTDRREPELTLRADVSVEYGEPLSMYELIDRVDDESAFTLYVHAPQGTVSGDGKSVSFPALGTYQVEMTALDEHGNSATESTSVEVVDTTPPELQAEEFGVYVGKELDYQSHVTAVDVADGDLTKAVKCAAGKVNLNEPGRYPISYTVSDRSGNTAAVKSYVTVSYPPAKKISLSEEEVWLAGNEYIQLKAKVKPSDWHGKVQWESSQPEVAEVSDGLVVWKGEGECVITATAGEQQAQCRIHCEPPRATEVRLSAHRLKLKQNESYQLTAQVLPSNWSGTVEWWSSDPTVATVDETGTVLWVGSGSCTIGATADECYDECTVKCERGTVQGLLEDLLGLGEQDGQAADAEQQSSEPAQTTPQEPRNTQGVH